MKNKLNFTQLVTILNAVVWSIMIVVNDGSSKSIRFIITSILGIVLCSIICGLLSYYNRTVSRKAVIKTILFTTITTVITSHPLLLIAFHLINQNPLESTANTFIQNIKKDIVALIFGVVCCVIAWVLIMTLIKGDFRQGINKARKPIEIILIPFLVALLVFAFLGSFLGETSQYLFSLGGVSSLFMSVILAIYNRIKL